MFTGLVSDVGTITRLEPRGALMRMTVASRYTAGSVSLGASIACNGPCLTVVGVAPLDEGCAFDVEIGAETLARTSYGRAREGDRLNLERSLRVGDELGGHLVTGHVDGVATIRSVTAFDGMRRFDIEVPKGLERFVAEKGSVALDGTSLTVNSVADVVLSVLLIPHTLAATTWGERHAGDGLNLEVDLMARYAARLAGHG